MLSRLYSLLLLISCFINPGQPLRAFSQDNVVENPDERIHHGDLIEIDELGGFDYDWRGRINAEGFLDGFTKIADPVFARCKSPSELAEMIRAIYSGTLRNPRVIVRVLDKRQRPVAIFDGAVRQPMRLLIRREVRLNELAAISGGFTDQASGEISVLRPPFQSCETQGDTAQLLSVRISDILSGKAESNLKILSGDIVTVKSVEPVYVVGGVVRPGRVDWRDGATVSRVVAAAGGVADRGLSGSVRVFRRGPDRVGDVIEIDLSKISAGKATDIEVHPYDIVDVPIRGKSRERNPPAIADGGIKAQPQPLPLRVIS